MLVKHSHWLNRIQSSKIAARRALSLAMCTCMCCTWAGNAQTAFREYFGQSKLGRLGWFEPETCTDWVSACQIWGTSFPNVSMWAIDLRSIGRPGSPIYLWLSYINEAWAPFIHGSFKIFWDRLNNKVQHKYLCLLPAIRRMNSLSLAHVWVVRSRVTCMLGVVVLRIDHLWFECHDVGTVRSTRSLLQRSCRRYPAHKG